MRLKKVMYLIKPPCPKCPYKLGMIHTVINPCPECKMNDYSFYERFLYMPWQGTNPKNMNK